MTKEELATRLKLATEANAYAFQALMGINSALRENNYGVAGSRCVKSIATLDEILNTNEELLEQ